MKWFARFWCISVLVFSFVSPAFAQKPGTPLNDAPGRPPSGGTLVEPFLTGPLGTLPPMVIHALSGSFKDGFLILLNTRVNPSDPATWRDVVAFSNAVEAPDCGSFGYSGNMVMITGAVGELGISDADLSRIPAAYASRMTVAGLTSLFGTGCVSLLPNQPSGVNVYTAGTAVFTIYTNPDLVTPTGTSSWGQLKLIYR